MSRHLIALTAMALLCAAAAFPAANLLAQRRLAHVPVNEVVSVYCALEKSNPPSALVKAKGRVTTGGYTNPRLVMVFDVVAPLDGIQDFLFSVDPPAPDMVVQRVSTEHETPEFRIERILSWMKGVRVGSATNRIEKVCS